MGEAEIKNLHFFYTKQSILYFAVFQVKKKKKLDQKCGNKEAAAAEKKNPAVSGGQSSTSMLHSIKYSQKSCINRMSKAYIYNELIQCNTRWEHQVQYNTPIILHDTQVHAGFGNILILVWGSSTSNFYFYITESEL